MAFSSVISSCLKTSAKVSYIFNDLIAIHWMASLQKNNVTNLPSNWIGFLIHTKGFLKLSPTTCNLKSWQGHNLFTDIYYLIITHWFSWSINIFLYMLSVRAYICGGFSYDAWNTGIPWLVQNNYKCYWPS